MAKLLDSARLLFELQRSHQITQSLAGLTIPEEIAKCVTDGVISQFGCAFARIWLVDSDRTTLRLVASSGLYTHINGSFARVPMGAYKVGKIAQNCVSFLSNNLPEETWVKDRDWAIANRIQGFAGYPLVSEGQAIGVLAIFSHQPLAAEFLEVLQGLCSTVTVALKTALQYQKDKQGLSVGPSGSNRLALSDRLAQVLDNTRLTLVGTEQPLGPSHTFIFLQVANILNRFNCNYCRLTYQGDSVLLEAIVGVSAERSQLDTRAVEQEFEPLLVAIHALGGTLQLQKSREQAVMQVSLLLPSITLGSELSVYIRCQQPILQLAFTQLAYLAGVTVSGNPDSVTAIVVDAVSSEPNVDLPILWIQRNEGPSPSGVRGILDLSIAPTQFRQAIEAVRQGKTWGMDLATSEQHRTISEREREIVSLLADGMRDREIAQKLHISESTVKFHMNKIMTKLSAKTRYQTLYLLASRGWL